MTVSIETTSLHPHPTEMASRANLVYESDQAGYVA